MLRVHDTALGRLVDLETREPGKVSMYVCGPTVYDVPHIGHGRFALVFDVIRRYLEWRGFEVRYVSNITDIEDKIIAKAQAEGTSSDDVVARYTDAWFEAMDALGVRRPDVVPTATAYVPQMVAYIADLIERGRAYVTADGVYFSVRSLEGYGLLAKQSLESMRAGGGDREIVGEAGKREPFDFALWKTAKPGEPAWESPWEPGRPGWHIECTVMALDLLGEGFDLHGGGDDLTFPHHENERAQAVAGDHPFARHWLHNGMVVGRGGEKMSKSLGNYVSLTELLASVDPRAYRLLVLRSKYRTQIEVTPETLDDAAEGIAKLDNFARRTTSLVPAEPADAVVDRFRAAMDDDFATPSALAVIFEAVRDGNVALDRGDALAAAPLAAAVRELTGALGLALRSGGDEAVDDESATLAAQRDEARAAKDWARADALRTALEERGWTVQDGAAGTRLTR
ncbi:MAG TPA: cysteine--tRNA ligase [Acidimicrobiales bacterium]|nr:cysteine--tRNA ligase [Acidimicrobiales bacterium]